MIDAIKLRAFVVALFVLGGCAAAPPRAAVESPQRYTGPMRDLTGAEKKAIADQVSRQLKDPGSAQFRWAKVPADPPTGPVKYCGLVNAKNSYGGYGGFAAFDTTLSSPPGKPPVVEFNGMDNNGQIGVWDHCLRVYGLDARTAI